MKYLRLFENDAAYSAFTQSEEWITPNVCYTNEEQKVMFNRYVKLPTDLSMMDINGNKKSARETANCYIIKETGDYRFPLVYGNAITNGVANSASYSTGSATFYNYNTKSINSPFIEVDTQKEAATAEVILIDVTGYTFENVSIENGDICRYVKFTVSELPELGGNAILAVKDDSGNIMWSWHLWAYPYTISFVEGTNGMFDVNLGWVKNSINSNTGKGTFYQWGRKDPFLDSNKTPAYGSAYMLTKATTSASIAIKNPTTFYAEGDNVSSWWRTKTPSSVYPTTFWNATLSQDNNTIKTIYDPCPSGFIIPCYAAFSGFTLENGGTWNSGYTWNNNYFYSAGYRNYNGSSYGGGYIWSANSGKIGSYAAVYGHAFYFSSNDVSKQNKGMCCGCQIRPVLIPPQNNSD